MKKIVITGAWDAQFVLREHRDTLGAICALGNEFAGADNSIAGTLDGREDGIIDSIESLKQDNPSLVAQGFKISDSGHYVTNVKDEQRGVIESTFAQLLEIYKDMPDGKTMLVHCAAGKNRSPAFMLGLIAAQMGDERTPEAAEKAVSELLKQRAIAAPSLPIVNVLDQQLGFNGALLQAVQNNPAISMRLDALKAKDDLVLADKGELKISAEQKVKYQDLIIRAAVEEMTFFIENNDPRMARNTLRLMGLDVFSGKVTDEQALEHIMGLAKHGMNPRILKAVAAIHPIMNASAKAGGDYDAADKEFKTKYPQAQYPEIYKGEKALKSLKEIGEILDRDTENKYSDEIRQALTQLRVKNESALTNKDQLLKAFRSFDPKKGGVNPWASALSNLFRRIKNRPSSLIPGGNAWRMGEAQLYDASQPGVFGKEVFAQEQAQKKAEAVLRAAEDAEKKAKQAIIDAQNAPAAAVKIPTMDPGLALLANFSEEQIGALGQVLGANVQPAEIAAKVARAKAEIAAAEAATRQSEAQRQQSAIAAAEEKSQVAAAFAQRAREYADQVAKSKGTLTGAIFKGEQGTAWKAEWDAFCSGLKEVPGNVAQAMISTVQKAIDDATKQKEERRYKPPSMGAGL